MTTSPDASGNYCYRHPDRQSFTLCQRCGRTVCPSCQTQAAVGVHCPECIKEARANGPKRKPVLVRASRASRGKPVVTYTLIGITVLMYLLQLVSDGRVYQALAYYPPFTAEQPWRMITSAFLHSQSSIFHLLFNMFTLFIFGRALELPLGRARFIALYLISALGGSVAVLLLAPQSVVIGASGAVFGLAAAFFVIQRRMGVNNRLLLIVLAANLVIGFIPGSGISWQAHLGGLITGAVLALVFLRQRNKPSANPEIALVALVVAALISLTLVRIFVL
ncbi:membrane associated rhomboid family serine protease [Salinibacterium amurskyense]|uniref:Membrane associated rhomboid family serine protease n=2 Tax=Salinibacterium amurskyense TaxID=205941 RepID=A0A2M9D5R3_9MICO|nr:rhomboid family intramembrane serine protease [Salinibacterium amurskyense]PJJ81047.1 membrane associated rhomboid family serine protease [Salinibacterium amurskyense]RLQ83077.1 rhomboid family intramembrane serine protease [Salinibacterium amurskyense]